MTVTFFGHSDVSLDIQSLPEAVLIELIETHGATMFYVGNSGGFDFLVQRTLERIKKEKPQIEYAVALAYLTDNLRKFGETNYAKTVFPECMDHVHPKYAIDKRNRWMIDKADVVVTYVTHPFGGAAKLKLLAEKKGKRIVNLPELSINKT